MRLLGLLLTSTLLAALVACGHKGQVSPTASLPPLLIDDRGISMPLEDAVTKIAYKPWIPPGQVLKYAVIAPLGGADTPANRGIAVEYEINGSAMLLSEWPKQNFSLLFLRSVDIALQPCVIAHFKSDGVGWTTHGALAMTLQPDGSVTPKAVEAEAHRLIANGACR
ncbi:MAG TPA: hypothetical protein VNF68_04880 [Candidatus Baltobacteraceae bacterium]|nr:hypothetical protein [Candidatus Baltobacteraceae bacterium]